MIGFGRGGRIDDSKHHTHFPVCMIKNVGIDDMKINYMRKIQRYADPDDQVSDISFVLMNKSMSTLWCPTKSIFMTRTVKKIMY